MKLWNSLLNLLGLGKSFEPAPVAQRVEAKTPVLAPEAHVHRGGRHSKRGHECPSCYRTSSRRNLCMNRNCKRFNAAAAHTHPDLLSLDRPIRMAALDRWARGGKAALFAKAT